MRKNGMRAWCYRYVDKLLFNEEKIRLEVESIRNDRHSEHVGGGGNAFISDPTATTALANIKPIDHVTIDGVVYRQPEEWLKIMAHVRSQCCDLELKVMEQRYHKRARVRTAIDQLYISRATYFNIVDGIIGYAVELGCQSGLLQVSRI